MTTHNVYRDDKVHVCKSMCKTCIFHPENRMNLTEGRVEGMIEESLNNDSAIICHSTLDGEEQAVCRGFFDRYKTLPLRVAAISDVIEFQEVE